MAKTPKNKPTLEQLEALLRAQTAMTYTIGGIFALIVLMWIVLGHWRENVPVFITTLAMAVGLTAIQVSRRGTILAEIRRRRESGE
ncbi:MAG: hypothetical protein MH204_11710 [Fimbriimonadaceae bacterium]|nr:hypothetical protein [Fimbriimonadaceae bacterium]